jgi:hypothetical protein
VVAAGWIYRDPLLTFYQAHFGASVPPPPEARPDPVQYRRLIRELAAKRAELARRYAEARTAVEISSVIDESSQVLETTLPAMMRCWLGTPWDHNGTCEQPGGGEIACGYFVSTILRDAGFRVERFRLAQQASENIIRTFLPRQQAPVRIGMAYREFLDEVKARGPGIRLVGLDTHAAFLVVPPAGEVRFIHSSGASPKCVVDEDRDQAASLRDSNYRVTGNLTRNPEVIHGWLTGASWPTKLPASS